MAKTINFQHETFTLTAKEFPNKICLIDGNKKYTYSQLDSFSNQIANFLVDKGIKPNSKICILIDKSFNLYASILGILKAGGCWVPLSSYFHNNRLENLIKKIDPSIIICSENNFQAVEKFKKKILIIDNNKKRNDIYTKKNINSQKNKLINKNIPITKLDLAYIIFTSGSTGQPKGVMVTHGNTVEFLNTVDIFFKPKKFLTYAHISEITFDPSIFDIFVCWKNAGTIIPFNKKIYKINPNVFFEDYKKINVIFTLPSLIEVLDYYKIKKEIKKIRYILFTGEPLFKKTIDKIKKINNKLKFFNVYGSTETAIISHYYELKKNEKQSRIPLGQLLPNFRSKLIGSQKNIGECYVTSPQVSIGYLNDEVSDKKYFRSLDENSYIKYYNIGDILKYDEKEKTYRYIGRVDDQVKINGIRLDLQELDSTILSIEGIIDVISLSGKKNNLINKIYTFIQVNEDYDLSEEDLVKKLKKEVPYYMLPKKIIKLNKFPRNTNGKIDKKKLIRNERKK